MIQAQQVPGQQVMYVYAPQGSFSVPGNPTMIAIPQGQGAQGIPQQQQINNIGTLAVDSRLLKHKRDANMLAVAALVTFFIGFFTFIVYLVSVIISLHMVRMKHIVKRRGEVIAFSVLELVAWAFVVTFSWYYDVDCSYHSYRYTCYTIWYGWISLVIWGVFLLAFGIPRIIFTWRHDSR